MDRREATPAEKAVVPQAKTCTLAVKLIVPPPRPSSSSSSSVAPPTARVRPAKRPRERESHPHTWNTTTATTTTTVSSSNLTPSTSSTPPPSTTRVATEPRQIELVIFSGYEIKTEYASPYPLEERGPLPNTTSSQRTPALVRTRSRLNPRRSSPSLPVTRLNAPESAQRSETLTEAALAQPTHQAPTPRSSSPELGLPTTTTNPSASIEAEAPTRQHTPTPPPHSDDTPANPLSPSESSDASADEVVAALVVPSPSFRQSSTASEQGSEIVKTEETREVVDEEACPGVGIHSAEPATTVAVEDTTPTPASPAAATVEKISAVTVAPPTPELPKRGQAGRFLSKPFHETVRGRRQLARLAAGSVGSGHVSDPNDSSSRVPSRGTRDRSLTSTNGAGTGRNSRLATKMETLAEPIKRMWVCEGCFKYVFEATALVKHLKECKYHHPPGRKVYQRGAHTIWEVDGAVEKLWCQNLCLFGKLFIEHKYMFFDLEGFLFYVVTDATPSRDWPLAYFSKEKLSYDDYNLACIVTFPPYRAKGWAALLIELSYEITRRLPSPSGLPGTPERPLSASGLASYRTYWTGTVVRYLRECFQRRRGVVVKVEEKKRRGRGRGFINALVVGDGKMGGQTTTTMVDRETKLSKRQRLSSRGGGPSRENGTEASKEGFDEAEDEEEEEDSFPKGLIDLAQKVHLRPEDVAFALVDSGLAQWRRDPNKVSSEESKDAEEEGATTMIATTNADPDEVLELCITEELVEQVAREKNVKPRGVLSMAYVLL